MAKKDNSPVAPVVTTLPLPNSDNAMVIDLPDGQKLVVGKMQTGTVIEVATWRGTGRPDSRTTRLMLGVSSQENIESSAENQAGQPKSSKESAVANVKEVTAKVLGQITGALSKAKKFKIEKPTTSPTLSAPAAPAASSHDADKDVQAWLDSIIAQSEKKEVSQGTIKPAAKKPAKKAATKKSTPKKATTPRRSR